MTSQEAAATAVAIVSSNLVPFVTEYLLGENATKMFIQGSELPIKIGNAAIVVTADDINGFAYALDLLLLDPELRKSLGENAYQVTIPYFTWENVVSKFLQEIHG